MHLSIPTQPPESEAELLERCQQIEGLTFYQLAHFLQRSIPVSSLRRKDGRVWQLKKHWALMPVQWRSRTFLIWVSN